MKTIKKFSTSILAFAILALTACSSVIDMEKATDTRAYLKINSASASRTVTPDYDINDMTDFVLAGKKTESSDIKQLATFENYTEMQQTTIPIAQGTWYSLTLTAYEEQTVFSATVNDVTIQSGENTITFALEIDETATETNTGKIRVTFSIPSKTAVKGVKVGLFNRSTDKAIGDYEMLTVNTAETGATAVYEKEITAGTHRMKAFFYADKTCTTIVSTYNELVRVVAGNTSQAERKIELNDIFTITEELNGGNYAENYTPATVYTRYSGVTLPNVDEMEKEGYFLDGWYTADDGTGEKITEISSTLAEDVTVYAKWIQGCVVYASKLSDTDLAKDSYGDTYMIRLLGEWTSLNSLASKMGNTSGRHITLDMTQITGVTDIGIYAFSGCTSLTSIMIGNGVTGIGNNAFWDCTSLESVTIGGSVTSIGKSAFNNCISLTSVTIPDSVTSIGERAFFDCTSLMSVTIGNGVTSIGDHAFWDCTSLESVTIGDGVTSIGYAAFLDCTSLESVTIGDGVTSIDYYAFYGCTSLEKVQYKGTLAQWCEIDNDSSLGANAQSIILSDGTDLKAKTELIIPDSVTSIGGGAFSDCTSLTSVTIPDSVTSIGDEAFYNCKSLEKVQYKGTLAQWCEIDNDSSLGYAKSIILSDGTDLKAETELIIPDSVTSIGNHAFDGCTSLTSVTIPDSVTAIEEYAFCFCTSLRIVTIPDSVTTIGSATFWNCTSLTSITIPNSVTTIGSGAFRDCYKLTSVNYNGSEGEWYKIEFLRDYYQGTTGLNGKTIIGKDGKTWTHTGN